jgi:hypothetical protein
MATRSATNSRQIPVGKRGSRATAAVAQKSELSSQTSMPHSKACLLSEWPGCVSWACSGIDILEGFCDLGSPALALALRAVLRLGAVLATLAGVCRLVRRFVIGISFGFAALIPSPPKAPSRTKKPAGQGTRAFLASGTSTATLQSPWKASHFSGIGMKFTALQLDFAAQPIWLRPESQ